MDRVTRTKPRYAIIKVRNVAAILPTLTADRASVAAACPNPKTLGAACVKAHHLMDAAIKSLSQQLHAAYHAYGKSLEAARAQFWAAIQSLPGEKHLHADKPIAVPHA